MDDNKVAVLLVDLKAQFRTFGEGSQLLNGKMDTHIEEDRKEFKTIQNRLDQNLQEHQQLMQMIKEVDTEVVQIKCVK
jgi:C4-dicarboxylate-specific signal transduction histidine kinase